jgi:hypothetical protein
MHTSFASYCKTKAYNFIYHPSSIHSTVSTLPLLIVVSCLGHIPAKFNATTKQWKNAQEHDIFPWLWATNFFPVENAEGDHINRRVYDNRRSNIALRPKEDNKGNRSIGGKRKRCSEVEN